MNEIMRHPVRMPKIIKVDIPVDLAYELKKLLEEHSRKRKAFMDGALAGHIAHRLWILLYQSKFSTPPSFTCLTSHWHSFCRKFVESRLVDDPENPDLRKMLACINAGQEVRSDQ
jgi:hypothetical protein